MRTLRYIIFSAVFTVTIANTMAQTNTLTKQEAQVVQYTGQHHWAIQLCYTTSIAFWLTRRLGLYDGPCPNLLRGVKVPIFAPLWLLVGTPSAIRPELASRRAEHILSYSDVTIYIPVFLIYNIYYLCCTCIDFMTSPPVVAVGLLLEVYLQFFKCGSFWLHGCCREWEGWARKPVDHTSWVAVVTQTDRPK